MKNKKDHFTVIEYICFSLIMIAIAVICIAMGSTGLNFQFNSIMIHVRIPRVLCVAIEGAALSVCGAAMQILLRNPLADGSTIGVSSGASLGAALSIAFGVAIPGIQGGGTMIMAIIFAFISLMLILSLAYKLDYSLSTNTIILIGVIFSMFANSIISFIVTFAGDKVKNITFWTMGSLAGSSYENVITLLIVFAIFGTIIFSHTTELNAFAMGENNARNIGVDVKKVKLLILISVAAIIGTSVSIGGTIGFVGLVIPHITRIIVGPNAKRLIPASLFLGATFLMLADLLARTILSPLELPIGVVTSFIGSIVFVYIFWGQRRKKNA